MATSTRDTTRTDAVVIGALTAVIAALVLVYGALFVVPAWEFAHVEQVYLQTMKGKVREVPELDALARSLRAAPSMSDLSRAAYVQMLTAQQQGLHTFSAKTRLSSARRDLRRGLAASPADGYAWTRLAVAELELGNNKAAAAALSMALELAPAAQGLAAMHFDLGVALWQELDARAQRSLLQKLKWARGIPALKEVVTGNSALALESHRQDVR